MNLHAGLVARLVGGRWIGALITGPSGSGKSDLALRLLDEGFVLVADDRTILWTSGGRLFGRAPESLVGQMEVRGQGIIRLPFRNLTEVVLVVDCNPAAPVERLPETETANYLGCTLALHRTSATEASAPAKLRHAVLALG